MPEIIFNKSNKTSSSCDGYRKIEKRGDLCYDNNEPSDDAIILYVRNLSDKIIIDCDKKTGEFHLKFAIKNE